MFLPNVTKIDLYNFELYRFKVGAFFFETQCTVLTIVWSITAWSPVSGWVKSVHLRFFGHLACTAPGVDHHHVIAAALQPPVY